MPSSQTSARGPGSCATTARPSRVSAGDCAAIGCCRTVRARVRRAAARRQGDAGHHGEDSPGIAHPEKDTPQARGARSTLRLSIQPDATSAAVSSSGVRAKRRCQHRLSRAGDRHHRRGGCGKPVRRSEAAAGEQHGRGRTHRRGLGDIAGRKHSSADTGRRVMQLAARRPPRARAERGRRAHCGRRAAPRSYA